MMDQQKRLNRLTVDLENDRLMIQKLDELNQQLEVLLFRQIMSTQTYLALFRRLKRNSMRPHYTIMLKSLRKRIVNLLSINSLFLISR
jgi:hypothetical protein